MNLLYLSIDPQVDDWPFMKSPLPICSILLFYLYFVLKLGPKWMENKKPYEMKWLMVLYNAYQVLFCTWLCAQVNYLRFVFEYAWFEHLPFSGISSKQLCAVHLPVCVHNGTTWSCVRLCGKITDYKEKDSKFNDFLYCIALAWCLVVLLLESGWPFGYRVLCVTQEAEPSVFPACLPSFYNVSLFLGLP